MCGFVSVQRGRGRRVFKRKRKNFKRSFKLGDIFIIFETKYKKINQADSLFVGGLEG